MVHPQGDPKKSNWEAPTDRTGLEGNRADMNSIATSVFTTCVFTDEPQGESLVQPQGGEPRESTRGVPTDRIGLEGNLAVLNSIATSVATTVVCTDEPQGESLVKPQGGEPTESNRGATTDRFGWEGDLTDENSRATSGFTDEHQGESLVLPQGKPRESDGGLPTDLTLETGFHIESAFEMLQMLGWEGNLEDVNSVATRVFKDHMLNYSIEAAQAWGLEFWAQQPEGALESAAELDSTELARVGDLQSLVEARQALQAHNRLSPQRGDRVTERVMKERKGIHNSLESVNWQRRMTWKP